MVEEEALSAALACQGETRELTTSAIDEREARENQQWRRILKGSDDWMGVWGKRSFPPVEQGRGSSPCRPVRASTEN